MDSELRKYEEVIKPLMGAKRFKHSVNVAEMSLTLAKKFGADENKAYLAGILHDCRKEAEKSEALSEAEKSGYYIDPAERDCFKLWHGIAGAYYIANELKITDKEILDAVRYHTVGRADMSKIEKIVFLADMVSMERSYTYAETYREAVLKDLDNGMFQTLRWSITKTAATGGRIPICTLEAYNFYSGFKSDKLLPI